MNEQTLKRRRYWSVSLLLLALAAALALVAPASAETGSVSVSALNNGRLTVTVTVSDPTASFGTALGPDGAAGGAQTTVTSAGTGLNQGVYYVYRGSGGSGVVVTVQSNKAWNGWITAGESTGTSPTIRIANGSLRYCTTAPTTYPQGSTCTAFNTTAQVWQTSHAKGTSTFTFYYGLRVDWTDTPGTFNSTVTYTATQ